jgi:hypothetical protein
MSEPALQTATETKMVLPDRLNRTGTSPIFSLIPTSMKRLTLTPILIGLCLIADAQETAPKWDVEIPEPITTPSEPRPEPEPIDFTVLSSKTTQREVTKAPELPELPLIQGSINVTVQMVADPNLPDPPPPLPALPPADPAVIARLEELREKYRGNELRFLSATVYDNHRTLLRIYPSGKKDKMITAWSNLNFTHFSGFGGYRVKLPDGSTHDVGLLMGIGSMNTSRMRQMAEKAGRNYEAPPIPQLLDFSVAGPAFQLVEGDAESPAMDTLEQVHDLYRKEGERMETAYHERVRARAEREAYLLANPPKPEDVVIQFWDRNEQATQP